MPLKRKRFILALQPHEVPPTRTDRSPWHQTLAFCSVLILLMGLSFSMNPNEHLASIKKGLIDVAIGEKICQYINTMDAKILLKSWYGIVVTCTEPTEREWLSYCQQFYVAEGGDCNAASNETKAEIMNNMRICMIED